MSYPKREFPFWASIKASNLYLAEFRAAKSPKVTAITMGLLKTLNDVVSPNLTIFAPSKYAVLGYS